MILYVLAVNYITESNIDNKLHDHKTSNVTVWPIKKATFYITNQYGTQRREDAQKPTVILAQWSPTST